MTKTGAGLHVKIPLSRFGALVAHSVAMTMTTDDVPPTSISMRTCTPTETPIHRFEELYPHDEETRRSLEAESIASALQAAGWRSVAAPHDPSLSGRACHAAYSVVTHQGAILTLEYHPAQRALHLVVADSWGAARVVMFYKERLADVLTALIDHQQVLSMDRFLTRIKPLSDVCRQTFWVGPRGALVRLS